MGASLAPEPVLMVLYPTDHTGDSKPSGPGRNVSEYRYAIGHLSDRE